jgi:hypothetical protein
MLCAMVHSQEPLPDTSEECVYCTDYIDALQIKWTNETTVEEILADLEKKCDVKYNFKQKQICDEIVSILVQVYYTYNYNI